MDTETVTTETTTETTTLLEGELELTDDQRCVVSIALWLDGESVDLKAESHDIDEALSTVMQMFYAVRQSWRGKSIAPVSEG